jgi:glycosyltransferase involved in cell wall biosynthesis
MKLIIQIPCFNEAETLSQLLDELPREIEGIDAIEALVIDDGSTDDTSAVARRCGVHHVLRHVTNRGLAAAFATGLDGCVARGADIIVNTDGDGQYASECIPDLVEPIVKGELEYVVGERPIEEIEEFSPVKKWLQRTGSKVVQRISGVAVPDATSGFRAMSREVALNLNISSNFTYTLESLIQCGDKHISVGSIPIKTNPQTRPSRLFENSAHYVWLSLWAILRITTWHAPLRLFWPIGILLGLLGAALGARFVVFYLMGDGSGHVQSLLLGAVLLVVGFQVILTGLMADMVATNRRTLEQILYRSRRHDADKSKPEPSNTPVRSPSVPSSPESS